MTQETLKACTVEGNIVKLPDWQVDRKVYLEVKNKMELIGGKWKGGKIQGFVFEGDPAPILAALINKEIDPPVDTLQDESDQTLLSDADSSTISKINEIISKTNEIVIETNKSERKCRVCGCTDNNCAQCIRLTGSPCHWVEEDLCSACVPQRDDEVVAALLVEQAQAQKIPTNFFTSFSPFLDGLDITIKLKRSAVKLTIEVLPVTGTVIAPVQITGTAEELDDGFFEAITKPIEKAVALKVDLDEYIKSMVKKDIEEVKNPEVKPEPKVKRTKSEAKKAITKTVKEKRVAPDMFAGIV